MNYLKTSGVELEDIEYIRGTVNNNKINESILRSKTKIFELAFCNPWDWFFTGTINPNKQDRPIQQIFSSFSSKASFINLIPKTRKIVKTIQSFANSIYL